MFSSHNISFYFREKCVKKISDIYALTSLSNFLPLGVAFIFSSKSSDVSRVVNELVLIIIREYESLLFLPRACIEKRKTTLRLREEVKPYVDMHFKRIEGFINESLEIIFENGGDRGKIETIKRGLNVFSSRLTFFLNLGFVFAFYKAQKEFKLKF